MQRINREHGWPCFFRVCLKEWTWLTMFFHGVPCYFMLWCVILLPWLTMVPWSNMVLDHGQTCLTLLVSQSIWPWLTMVSLVQFNVHGRPWSNHGQTIDRPWFTMVTNHGPDLAGTGNCSKNILGCTSNFHNVCWVWPFVGSRLSWRAFNRVPQL